MKKVQVFAPNSVANVGCGYDILGFALEKFGDLISVSVRNDDQVLIDSIEGADLPYDSNKNVACVAVNALLSAIGETHGFDISIKKSIPPGSGLGSSASSSVGAVYAVNELLNSPFTRKELVAFAMEGERLASGQLHADNVAPSMLGGFTAVRSCEPLDVFNIPFPNELLAVIIYPQVTVNTSEAKKMLKSEVSLKDSVSQSANLAGLISGLMSSDFDRIGNSLQDLIAEPIRKSLIPHYDEVKLAALNNGALGFNISGSGPSMFALTHDKETSAKIEAVCSQIYKTHNIPVISFVSSINTKGAHIS